MNRDEISKLVNSSQVWKFNSPALAQEFVTRAHKILLILQGDDGKFWATTPRVAKILESAGYEIVG